MNKPKIEIDTDGTLREIADGVKEYLTKDYGFMVFVFKFNDDTNSSHYISNAKRENIIKVLREKADVLEQKLDIQNNQNSTKIQ